MRGRAPRWASDLLRETPVVLFFAWALSLAITFHGREIMMLDHALTFDHWWYFHRRLGEGGLAQWNPFSLLGRSAVQWSYVPASLFSPLIALADLTLDRFRAFHVAGTWMVLCALYATGRLAGYGRWLPLVPVLLVAASGFRYWISFLHFATLLTALPLTIGYLLRLVNQGGPRGWRQPGALALLLALSFLGLRIELMVYAVALVVLVSAALGWSRARASRSALGWVAAGIGLAVFALAASAWQLAYLVSAAVESRRLAPALDVAVLLDPFLWKWLGLILALQPATILLALNLAALALCGARPRLGCLSLSWRGLGLLLGLEALVAVGLRRAATAGALRAAPHLDMALVDRAFGFLGSAAGVAAVVLASVALLRAHPSPSLRRSFGLLAALAAGFQVATYAGHTWTVNASVHPFFVPLPLTGLLALGAAGLWLRGQSWLLAALVAYHAIGEVGALLLLEGLGIPWLPPRAAILELPLQVILILEAGRLVIETGRGVLIPLTPARVPRILPWMRPAGAVAASILAAMLLERALLPTALAEDPAEFPFGGSVREVPLPNGSLERWVKAPDGAPVPEGCIHRAEAPGSVIERASDPGAAAHGESAARLRATSAGGSWLRCAAPHPETLRGRHVRFLVSVRSADSYPGAVEVDVQDGVGPIAFARHGGPDGRPAPAGQWTTHSVVTRIAPTAGAVMLTVNATAFAAADVDVDDLRLEVTDAEPRRRRVHAQDFPFDTTPVGDAAAPRNRWLADAAETARRLRALREVAPDPFHRKAISDDVFLLSPAEQYYRFLPAHSLTPNTAPLYASEIPAPLRDLFPDRGTAARAPLKRLEHPDMGPMLLAYQRALRARNGEPPPGPYPTTVTLLPHRSRDPVLRELLAEEGGQTPRAFLAGRVVTVPDPRAERAYLSAALARGQALTEVITTSDPGFRASESPASGMPGGRVDFVADEPERVALDVATDRDAYLALLDLWSPGWTATVDGRETAIHRGYATARFVAVPAGRHRVEFSYRVPGLRPAAALSLLVWGAGLALVVLGPGRLE